MVVRFTETPSELSLCAHSDVITTDGRDVCRDCGLVLQEISFSSFPLSIKTLNTHSPENRLYKQKFHPLSPSTSSEQKEQFQRLNKFQQNTWLEKRIIRLLNICNANLEQINIRKDSTIYEEILRLLYHVAPMRKQGRSQKAFVCAVIFLAHKNLNISIRYKELVKIFNVKSRDVYKIITLLSSTIKKTNKRQNTNLRNYFQKEIINKHFQGMFSDSVVFKGTRIAYVLEKMLNGNYNPLTVSSGICYYLIKIENVKVDQKALAKKLGVSDYAIRKWYYHIKTKVLYRP